MDILSTDWLEKRQSSIENSNESIEGTLESLPFPSINPRHFQEWLDSGIDPELIRLNLHSLEGQDAADALRYALPMSQRRNDGRLKDKWIRSYEFAEKGGWWCPTLNLEEGRIDEWGCFKADHPRGSWGDGGKQKTHKYEHPAKTATKVFFLQISLEVWKKVSDRWGVAMPQDISEDPLQRSLTFWNWVLDHPEIPRIICEGVKKAAALLSQGVVAIGLPGINMACVKRTETLKPELKPFIEKATVGICFDSDSKREARRSTEKAIKRLGRICTLSGANVYVHTWKSSLGKGIDDVLVSQGVETFEKIISSPIGFGDWKTKQILKLDWEPTKEVSERYLEYFSLPDEQIIAIKSPKGTGKSVLIRKWGDDLTKKGERILLLTHRIRLGQYLASRLGIPFAGEFRELVEGTYYGLGICVDSLHEHSKVKFDPEEWEGCTIIIDEVAQVFYHLLMSQTLQRNRVKILQILQEILRRAKRIIIADADLTDLEINLIRNLIGTEEKPSLLVNDYQDSSTTYDCHLYNGSNPNTLIATAEEQLREGGRLFIFTDGQKKTNQKGTQILEEYFRRKFPNLRILRIDSESTNDPNHPAYKCLDSLDEVLKGYDLVIASPSIETGVSIDLKGHFTAVFGIFNGVLTVQSMSQSLARVREPVDRFVWCRQAGNNKIGNGMPTVKGLMAGQNQITQAMIGSLMIAGFDPWEEKTTTHYLTYWSHRGAAQNLQKNYTFSCLVDFLEAEGHKLRFPEETPNPEPIKEKLKEISTELYSEHCKNVVAQDSVSDHQYQKLESKIEKTETERLTERKGELERKYKGLKVTPELVRKDDQGWGKKLRLLYDLTRGREFVNLKDKALFDKAVQDGGAWLPDLTRRIKLVEVLTMEWLKIPQLLELEELSTEEPLVREIVESCRKNPWILKNTLRLTVSEKLRDMGLIRRLLAKISFSIQEVSQRTVNGKRIRIFSKPAHDFEKTDKNKVIKDSNGLPIPIRDERDIVFDNWYKHDLEKVNGQSSDLSLHVTGNKEDIYIRRNVQPISNVQHLEPIPDKDSSQSAPNHPRNVQVEEERVAVTDGSEKREGVVTRWGEEDFDVILDYPDGQGGTVPVEVNLPYEGIEIKILNQVA